jgi:hypothetical protein
VVKYLIRNLAVTPPLVYVIQGMYGALLEGHNYRMSGWKAVGIPLICGLICVGLGAINIWLGILATPIMYSLSKDLLT